MTPEAGRTSYWVVADAPGDLVPGNDVVRTELVANPAADASVLVVDNDLGWTQEQTVQASLLALGVPHDVVEGEPDAETLAAYDAAIWLTSGVSGATGVLSPAGWDAITSYLDGGGKVWLASNRAVGYASSPAVARSTQLAEYFGVVGDNNILDPLGDVMTGQGDAIGGSRDVLMSYIDGRPYLDYFHLATEVAEPPAAPRGRGHRPVRPRAAPRRLRGGAARRRRVPDGRDPGPDRDRPRCRPGGARRRRHGRLRDRHARPGPCRHPRGPQPLPARPDGPAVGGDGRGAQRRRRGLRVPRPRRRRLDPHGAGRGRRRACGRGRSRPRTSPTTGSTTTSRS